MANQDLLQLAMKAHREGDFAAAERLYSKQLRQTPGEFNTLHMLGVMRAQQGRFAEAEASSPRPLTGMSAPRR